MAITLQSQVKDSVSLEEYIEFIKEHIDPYNYESLIDAADITCKLGNNRVFYQIS